MTRNSLAPYELFNARWDIAGTGMEHIAPGAMSVKGPAVPHKFPLKDGDELGTYSGLRADDYEDKSYFEGAFEIAFGEGQALNGQAVIPSLTQLIDFAERLIDIFARRIFGIAW